MMAAKGIEKTVIRAFYAPWDAASERHCRYVKDALGGGLVELFDLVTHQDGYARTGMRTVPAFEILRSGRPTRVMSGMVEVTALRAALDAARNPAVADLAGPISRIEPLEVVGSTGSYRYDRWGEQFLTDYRHPEGGWSSPTRADQVFDELVFDALGTHRIQQVSLTPRGWAADPTQRTRFPRAFDIDFSVDRQTWKQALSVTSFECTAPVPQHWQTDGIARYLRVIIRDATRGGGGKYACQLMKFEAWGEPLDRDARPRLAVGSWRPAPRAGSAAQVTKLGLLGLDEPCATSVWHLRPGAALPPRHCRLGRGKLFVVHGAMDVNDHDHGETFSLQEGDWVSYRPGSTISFKNPSETSPASIFEVKTLLPDDEVWGVPS